MKPSLLERNLALAKELLPEKQWSAEMWLLDCDRLGFRVRVAEVYRSQARQNQLFAQGRTAKGRIVTWTKSSKHTSRLAMDVYPENCTYGDIVPLALAYGIRRDPALVKLGDLGHFEFDAAMEKPTPSIPKSEEAAKRRLAREIKSSKPPRTDRLKERLAKRQRLPS